VSLDSTHVFLLTYFFVSRGAQRKGRGQNEDSKKFPRWVMRILGICLFAGKLFSLSFLPKAISFRSIIPIGEQDFCSRFCRVMRLTHGSRVRGSVFQGLYSFLLLSSTTNDSLSLFRMGSQSGLGWFFMRWQFPAIPPTNSPPGRTAKMSPFDYFFSSIVAVAMGSSVPSMNIPSSTALQAPLLTVAVQSLLFALNNLPLPRISCITRKKNRLRTMLE